MGKNLPPDFKDVKNEIENQKYDNKIEEFEDEQPAKDIKRYKMKANI